MERRSSGTTSPPAARSKVRRPLAAISITAVSRSNRRVIHFLTSDTFPRLGEDRVDPKEIGADGDPFVAGTAFERHCCGQVDGRSELFGDELVRPPRGQAN